MPNLLNGDRLSDFPEPDLHRVVGKVLSTYALYYDGTNIDELIAYINSLSDEFNIDSLEFTNTMINEDGLATIDLVVIWSNEDRSEDRCEIKVEPNSFLIENTYNTESPFLCMERKDFYTEFSFLTYGFCRFRTR